MSDGSDEARPLQLSHSAQTEIFLADVGAGGGHTSFGSGNENPIELIDGSRELTSSRWDKHGGESKDMVG